MVDPLIIPVFGIIIGLPALCLAVTSIVKRVLRHRETMAQLQSGEPSERAAVYAAKIERLEQRMGVMERILTDRSTQLGDEIERLRDAPIN
jgi:hypothetical protein